MKARHIIYGLALAAANYAYAGYTPVAITQSSYNADVIVESNARPTLIVSTSASIDEGTNNYNNTLFEVGFDTNNPANGVPAHNTTFTARDNGNYSYKMAPSYNAPNGILIDSTITNGAFNFTTPAAYGVLSFIGLGGNGGDTVAVKVFHQDGTTESGNYGVPDWFNGTSEIACIMGGRCTQVYNLTTEVSANGGDGLGNPRIYHREITLTNTTSPVTKVTFTYVTGSGGSHSDIMAVSGGVNSNSISPITVTGYDQDFVVEATAPHDNRVASQVVVDGTNVWSTTESMDNTLDTATSWYEQGYNINNDDSGSYNNINDDLSGTGLPHPSAFVTNATGDHVYQMPANYETNDAIYISTTVTNDSITLATPAAFSGISFLGAAGNGPMTVNVIIHHSGAADENLTLTVADWFNGSETPVIACNGRVAVDTAQFSNIKGGFPAVFENDIALQNTTAPVTGLEIYNTNLTSGRFSLFALSGISGALPPIISAQPVSTNNYEGTDLSMSATITANATITYQWEFQTNNTWVNVVNGGHVSGANASTLVLNPLQFSDQGNYRLLATDSGGEAITGTVTVDVFSTNVDVTQQGDPISGVNISPFGDGSPAYAIDNTMDTKFGANFNAGAIPGLIVTPSVGQTIITGLRIYTGADTTGRDPTSFEIYGSVDGGHSYTLITSNGIVLSDNRNPLSTVLPDPLTQYCTEVRFLNTTGYTTYKLLFPTFKQNIDQIQFQEMELLGVKDNAKPYFSPEPFDAFAYNNSSASFTASVVFTNTTTEAWYKSVNGTVTPLSDGGNISGTQTATLSINPVSFSDAVDYFAVANSSVGAVTSSVAHLYVYSTETNVIQPTDPVGSFGNSTAQGYLADDNPVYVIDGTTIPWQAEGHGVGAQAGFPPWEGPVGVWVTPAAGPTIVNGIRFYSGQDSSESDPAAYILEGGNGGTNGSFTVIAQGAITLPQDRSIADIGIDPTQDPALEILFNNTTAYTTYRITFPTLVDTNDVSYLEIGEVQLLGSGVGVTTSSGPHLGNVSISGGNITISATDGTPGNPYTILTNSAINAPLTSWGTAASGTFDSNGSLQTSLPVRTNTPYLFYVIKTQ